MQAVLDAVTEVAGIRRPRCGSWRSPRWPQIRQALEQDAYHVLHLSAHGSPDAVELEDEDGAPSR